jgi:integrase
MASIRKKGRGYEARVKAHGTMRSKSFATMQQARAWARSAELDLISAANKAIPPTPSITLRDALKRYEAEVLPKLKGAPQERYRLAALETTAMSSKCLGAITASDVKAYRDQLVSAGNSGSTVRLKLALVSRVFNVAAKEWGYTVANPVAAVTKPPAGNARSRRFTGTEEQRLLESAGQCQNPHIAPLIGFAIETGMRRGEMLSMTWDDVDLLRSVVTLLSTKSGHPRWVPLSRAAKAILQHQLEAGAGRPFPIPATLLENAWEHVLKRAGIKDLRFHDLRHEALSRWAHRLNGDVFKLSLVSGHRTLQMAQRYVHPVQSEILAQIAA